MSGITQFGPLLVELLEEDGKMLFFSLPAFNFCSMANPLLAQEDETLSARATGSDLSGYG